MKSTRLAGLCLAAGLTSPASFASTFELHTFGENEILPKINSPSAGSGDSYNTAFGYGGLRGLMEVSNDGAVVYLDTEVKAKSWRLETGLTYSFPIDEVSAHPNITTDGELALAQGRVHRFNGSEYVPVSEWLQKAWYNKSSVAQLNPGGTILMYDATHRGTIQPNSEYPALQTFASTKSYGFYLAAEENPAQFLYEMTLFVDADEAGDTFLMTTPTPVEGQPLANADLILMDRTGRYLSDPINVEYGVSMTSDTQKILAYLESEDCPTQTGRLAGTCSTLWDKHHGHQYIGNFKPIAMSGSGDLVVGVEAKTPHIMGWDAANEPAIVWDPVNGEQNFVSYVTANGADLSGWSQVRAVSVSKDGSKIVGHGINSQGNTSGFLINIPSNASKDWLSASSSAEGLELQGNWAASNGFNTSSSLASSIKFEFEGDQFSVTGARGSDQGIAYVIVDGIQYGTIDAFACSDLVIEQLYKSPVLKPGKHTVEIVVTGMSHQASQGTAISIESIGYHSKAAPNRFFADTSIAQPALLVIDPEFNLYNQTNPDFSNCSTWWGTTSCNSPDQRYRPLWDLAEHSLEMDQILAGDGNFAIESWFRASAGPLLEIDAGGKNFSIMQNGGDTISTSEDDNGITVTMDLREPEHEWDHIIVTGNWFSGDLSIYLNGEFAANATAVDVTDTQTGKITLARVHVNNPTPANSGVGKDTSLVKVAKFSVFEEALSSADITKLYEYPQNFGLDFAPFGSPAYSTRLPGCSQGCEHGVDYVTLPSFGGYTSGNLPGGGFPGGGF